MGKKESHSLRVSYNKRKRGLLRKAIELSNLCKQDIFIVILDRERQNMVEFNSSKEFNHLAINSLHQNDVRRQLDFELYGNEDYDALENKFIANYQYKNIQSKNGLCQRCLSNWAYWLHLNFRCFIITHPSRAQHQKKGDKELQKDQQTCGHLRHLGVWRLLHRGAKNRKESARNPKIKKSICVKFHAKEDYSPAERPKIIIPNS